MPLPIVAGNSKIFTPIKEAAKSLMEAFTKEGSVDLVWEDVVSWMLTNRLSIPQSLYPVVFFTIPRYVEVYHAIKRKNRWEVELQIEFHFMEYTEEDEEVALEWVEELSRMVRLNPVMGQPSPDDFIIFNWIMEGAEIDYTVGESFMLLSAICSTKVTLLDCRSAGGS